MLGSKIIDFGRDVNIMKLMTLFLDDLELYLLSFFDNFPREDCRKKSSSAGRPLVYFSNFFAAIGKITGIPAL